MTRPQSEPGLTLPLLAAAPWLLGMAAFGECMTLFAHHARRPARTPATHDLNVPEPLERAEMPELFA